jgi:hypothetical protein
MNYNEVIYEPVANIKMLKVIGSKSIMASVYVTRNHCYYFSNHHIGLLS